MQILSEKLVCCLCENTLSVPWKVVDSYELLKCRDCGLIHLGQVEQRAEDFLSEAAQNKGLEYWGYPEIFKKYSFVFDSFFEERLERLLEAKPPEGEWLDIGTGYGLWQSFLKKKAIYSKGIEIDENAFSFCLNEGLDVELSRFENWKVDQKFAVITMCDVLEHVPDPVGVLNRCRELLLPGGILYLQVPSVLGLRFPYNDSMGLPHHLWQFTPLHLNQLVKKSGFVSEKWWTGVQGVIRHYESGGPSLATKVLWKIAMFFKRGNRLQMLLRNK